MAFVFIIASIVGQIVALFHAVQLARLERRPGIIVLAIAVALMLGRTAVALYNTHALAQNLDAGAEFISLLISISMAVGLVWLRSRNESLSPARTTAKETVRHALDQDEHAYRNLVETSQDLICAMNEQGRITFANAAAFRILGYQPSELMGRRFTDFQAKEQTARALATFGRIMSGESFTDYETTALHRNGTTVWLNLNMIPVRNGQGTIVGATGTAHNITDRKQSELALRESEERYRRIVETAGEGIWMIDADARTSFVNPRMAAMLGYTVEEMRGRPLMEFIDDDWRAAAETNLERRKQGISEQHDFRFVRKDGTILWGALATSPILDAGGAYVGALAMVTDISERKRTLEALRRSEAQMRRLIDSNLQGVIFTDTKGNISLANDAFLRMTGYSREDLAEGRVNWNKMTPPEYAQRDRQAIEELATTGICTPWEKEYIRKDGSRLPVYVGVAAFSGKKDEGVAFVIDISDRKRTEQALRENEEIFRRMIEYAPEAVVLLDMGSGKFTRGNKAAEQMFGMSEAELSAVGPLEMSPEIQPDGRPSQDKAAEFLGRAMADETPVFEWTHRDKAGREFPCEIRLLRLIVGGRAVIRGSIIEISERKRSENILQEYVTKLQGILRAAPVGIGMAANRQFAEVNGTLCQMLGYTREELIGRDLRFLYESDEEYQRIGREYRQLDSQIRGVVETRYLRKDGQALDVIVTAVLVAAANPAAGVIFTVMDCTETKKAEQAARLGSTALAAAANAICVTNREGTIEWVNPAFTKLYGYSAAEAIGRNANLVGSGLHDKAFFAELWRTILAGRVWHGQITNRHKDGHLCLTEPVISPVFDTRGEITHFVGILHDVTERHEAEKALRLSREQFVDLFDNAPVGYHEVDAEGRFTRINRTELRMLGHVAEELLGQYAWTIAADQRLSREAMAVKLGGAQSPSLKFERIFRRKDGTVFPVLIEDRILRNEQGVIIGIRSVVQDITDRKKAEEKAQHLANFPELNPNPVLEFTADGNLSYHNPAALAMAQLVGFSNLADLLPPQTMQIVAGCLASGQPLMRLETRHGEHTLSWSFYPIAAQQVVHCYVGDISKRLQLEEQFRQAQKMEAIGQLSGGVAHDFNNLLTVILGNLGLLQSSGQVSTDVAEPLQAIAHAANRAANLTRQLLAFSRQQVMQQENLDLNAVVGHISKMLRRVIGEAVKIRLDYALQALPIHADQGMLEQVILNLCINARDAMPQGGQLILRTAAIDISEEEARLMVAARAGSFAMMIVTDTGTGIAPENMKRVFEPFFTTKEVGKGTGLGLASVYGIAQQHNGWVTVESELGRGTTFTVFLPLLPAPILAGAEPSHVEKIPRGTETILLVEDDLAVQTVTKITLQRLGYQVLVASNGHQALRIWQDRKAQVRLVLTDMIMPEGLSGRDIARQFKSDLPGIRIIFMSGYSADIAGTDFAPEEGDHFIGKPFEMHALAMMIRKSLDDGRGR